MTFSLHALLLCNDLAGMLRCMWEGFPVDDEHLALDVTRSAGLKGSYLGEKHTVSHCRDNYWKTRYFGVNTPLSSNHVPKHDLFERIDKDLREILANHRPKPMPEAIREQVHAVHAKFETSP
jgi:trimethylamine--corrinoid protein Co-methyltransferase